ncbi:hypothetical protein QTP86_031352, partial [Hemibagrus guttatus]
MWSESREQVEENLERWRFALERRGMKVSGSKTEYMCVNEREGSGTVRLQGEEVKKVQEFKYLGSTVQSNGECGKESWLELHSGSLGLFIDGTFVHPENRQTLPVSDSKGEDLCRIVCADDEDILSCTSSAAAGFHVWKELSDNHRAKVLLRLASSLQRYSQCVCEVCDLCQTPGSTPALIRLAQYYAGWAQLCHTLLPEWSPRGVVAVMSDDVFFYSLWLKVLPALAVGNAVIVVPGVRMAPPTLLLAQLLKEAGLPAGVLNVVTGNGSVRVKVAQNSRINHVTYIGSKQDGELLVKQMAGRGIPVSLSLSVCSVCPFIVFETADVDSAVDGLMNAALKNYSEWRWLVCVQESVYDAVVEKLKFRMVGLKCIRVSDEFERGRVDAAVREAEQQGATLIQSCPPPSSGCVYPPTVVCNTAPSSSLVVSPPLGPVVPLLSFRSAAEAVALGNCRPHGQAASIWTEDLTLALETAKSLCVGSVCVNTHSVTDPSLPQSGRRESGTCTDGGREGLYQFLSASVALPRSEPVSLDYTSFGIAASRFLVPESSDPSSVSRSCSHLVGGKVCKADSGSSRAVLAPGGAVLAHCPDGGRKDVRNAVEAALKVQPGWMKKSPATRALALYSLADSLEKKKQDMAASIHNQTGLSMEEAAQEVEFCISWLSNWAALCDKQNGHAPLLPHTGSALSSPEAVGVVGVVLPDTKPLLSMVSVLGATVSMGNAIIIVPSERFPLPALDFIPIVQASDVPAGVVSVISGGRDQLTRALANHNEIQAIWYWGSAEGAGGNWATVGGRSRGGRRVHRQREKRKGKSVGLRIGTLNVGTMTGKGRELADMMERRKVDILCVQETRWKGSKAGSIGAGFKLFYYGVDSKRNGVGVVLKEEFVRNVLQVKRVSDRVMSLKLEIEGVMLNVVSGYAPQVGCELEEKERFWSELDEVMESIPTGERVVIGADFNGHVGEGNTGDEEVMGKFGVKERNLEGQMVVDFAKRMDMGVVNTYFQKREEHRVTYKSGGRRTQVEYILCRRDNLKEISDCKVVVGESVARQHRMVVCRMTLMVCKKKRSKIEIEKKTKWWKLKKEECCEEFRQKLRQALGGQVVLPDDWETTAEVIRETGRKVLGVSSGRRKEDKETWWWNEEVQDSVQGKRLAKRKWDMDRTEENRQEYKELQRRVKREVSKAKQKAYDELYTRLDTREGQKDLYRLARQRDRDGKDVQQVRVIKDRDGRVLTSEESVQRRWKEYFEELMNEENEREKRVEGVNSVEQKVDKIRKDEVRKALKRMKSGKAVGPDDIPVEVWKCLGEAAVEFLTSLFNRVLESERMPEEWRRSVLVPIFKNKGDVQSCSNYRGIKLMSHTMKLWERVVEARLRKVVEICEQQYGFMPRKSTTDAIFALRILMEKYRDGQRELHCVFVDLEKAYDRVPREELWYCMRKSGVAENYVRVVQDMYERSRTVVRCAVGQTEEFNVEVGLHQGSALSPFLFAIVMDQLSEEVRQESPWTMMLADDIVICSESREQVEENLERWRFALERRGMKVSGSKTEYMCVNEREGSGTVRLQGEEMK